MPQDSSKYSHRSGAEFQGELFMRLFMANQSNIYAFILSLVPNWADADDLMQETATVMWTKFGEFELGTNFLSWGMTVAYFETLKFRKQRQRNRLQFTNELLESIAQDAVNTNYSLDDTVEALRECILKMRHRDRQIVQLRYQKSKSIKEVAQFIGKSVESLYKTIARIHHALLQCVQRKLSQGDIV
jgi:RNA polymerase sigma-70 factor (ECF subfamily)